MIAATTALLTYGEAPTAKVQMHVLFTGVQTDPLALVAAGVEIAMIGLYLLGVRRLTRRGRHWSALSSTNFVAGIVVIWIAVGSGLAAYDDVNVVAHVVQHIILMMVAPPLLVMGKPITLATQAARRRNQVRILKVVHSRVLALLTFPVLTWFLYYGVMYAFFLDRRLYDYAVNHVLFHDATHLIFLAVGYLYWQPLIGLDPTRWRLSHPIRILTTFVGMPFEAFLGIAVAMSTTPIDPINTLANTKAAGNIFWILAMAVTGPCIAVMALRWYRQIQRQTPREDRFAVASAEESSVRAAQLGVEASREGWTIPPWRLAQLEAQAARRARQATGPES